MITDQSEDAEVVNTLTAAMREADRVFETVLNRNGWRVVRDVAQSATTTPEDPPANPELSALSASLAASEPTENANSVFAGGSTVRQSEPEATANTCEGGVAVRWCPKCGTCVCATNQGGDEWEVTVGCPIHDGSHDPIVGHSTFSDGHHEPIRQSEAAAIIAVSDAAKVRRAEQMPDERAAIDAMFEAWLRLKELGWKDAQYCPKDGSAFDVIEPGSTGIHRCRYQGEWPKGSWWIEGDGDLWPSRPVLFRRDEATGPTSDPLLNNQSNA